MAAAVGLFFLTGPLVQGSCAAGGRTFSRWDVAWEFPWDLPSEFPWDVPWDVPREFPWGVPREFPWDVWEGWLKTHILEH